MIGAVLPRLRLAIAEGRLLETLLPRVAPRTMRAAKLSLIADMAALGGRIEHSPEAALGPGNSYDSEYTDVSTDLRGRYATQKLPYPENYGIEALTGQTLYALVRISRPDVILETGVANGHSTAILLAAVIKNGRGVVHSTDIDPNAGALLTPVERARWVYHRLPLANLRRAFQQLVTALPPMGLFVHDSGHSYRWQAFEYATAWPHLMGGAWLVSDDADASYAFIDHCRQHGLNPIFLFDQRKIVGLVRHP